MCLLKSIKTAFRAKVLSELQILLHLVVFSLIFLSYSTFYNAVIGLSFYKKFTFLNVCGIERIVETDVTSLCALSVHGLQDYPRIFTCEYTIGSKITTCFDFLCK